MKQYTITNEKYKTTEAKLTINELNQIRKEMDWPFDLYESNDKVYNGLGEIVAEVM